MKQAFIIRTDLSTGKLAVQARHDSVAAIMCAGAEALERWTAEGQTIPILLINPAGAFLSLMA